MIVEATILVVEDDKEVNKKKKHKFAKTAIYASCNTRFSLFGFACSLPAKPSACAVEV
jgi:hypothetical protein